jgi:sugar phosphate permease
MSTAVPSSAGRSLHYGWIVAAITFVTLLAAAGIRATPGVLIVPLEQEFGWSRASISFAISINLVLYGFMGPFSAALVDRLGTRATMLIAMATLGVGVCLTSLMTATWQLVLLWGVVVGAGSGMIALALSATIVNRWFAERRGLVMGVLTASTATGQLVFLPFLAAIVERWGWRPAVLTIAGIGLLTLIPVGFFMRNRPSDLGLAPYGQAGPAPAPVAIGNPVTMALETLGEGLRSRDFWLLATSFFICGLSTNGLIGTHLIPACIDQGIPEVMAASLLAMMGVFDFIGTTLSGWLSDRWNNNWLLCWYYGLRGLSLLFLPMALESPGLALTAFAVFYGLDWIATVPPTLRLTANIFGKARAGMMFGWIVASHQIGAAVASFGAGAIRTYFGDYFDAFVTAGAFCLVAAAMVLLIGRRRQGERVAVESAAATA